MGLAMKKIGAKPEKKRKSNKVVVKWSKK